MNRARAASWLLLAALASPARAQSPQPLPRKILALYDRKEISDPIKDPYFSPAHRAELPLNHLGMEVVYRDIGRPWPGMDELAGYRGILAWFGDPAPFADPGPYCRFLTRAMESGLRVVLLGEPGMGRKKPGGGQSLPGDCRKALRTLGIALGETLTPAPEQISFALRSPLVEFERRLAPEEFPKIPMVRPAADATSFLRIEFLDRRLPPTTPVAAMPRGGAALGPFAMYENEDAEPYQMRWRIDPFRFFEKAFGLAGWPRPDATTANGRRIFFSQIDGDGFFNVSEVDGHSWSGEIFLHDILEAEKDSPFTASVITGYYTLPRFQGTKPAEVTRRILNLPNVEPAAHGFAHPLIWSKRTVALSLPGYRFDARREILGSLEDINRLFLPPGRPSSFFLWTGNSLPTASDLELIGGKGLYAINGGGGRFDRRFPSVAFLHPLSRMPGGVRQVFAPQLNENEYTNLWEGPYYGYREVLETFANTESPRRIKPVDVYVHYYSAEKIAALKTLKKIYAWARGQPLFPTLASEYIRIVSSFFDMRITPLGPDRFLLEGGPGMRTIRFDDETRYPDMDRSRGVLGFARLQNSLYVFLSEEAPREVRLAPSAPTTPYVADANFAILGFRREAGAIRLLKKGWWDGTLTLGGLEPRRIYRISYRGSDSGQTADSSGAMTIKLPGSELQGEPSPVLIERR